MLLLHLPGTIQMELAKAGIKLCDHVVKKRSSHVNVILHLLKKENNTKCKLLLSLWYTYRTFMDNESNNHLLIIRFSIYWKSILNESFQENSQVQVREYLNDVTSQSFWSDLVCHMDL